MVMSWNRPSTVVIDTNAIKENIQKEMSFLQPSESVFAVVKADGYGHGAVEVSKTAVEAGAKGICVATLDEALELRREGIEVPILVLGLIEEQAVGLAQKNQVSITVASNQWLENVLNSQYLDVNSDKLNIHLKIDTGMGRIGYQTITDFHKGISFIEQHELLELEGVFTHFATADEADTAYFDKQQGLFSEYVHSLDKKPKYIHCANSATAIWHKETPSNIVRMGIAMYGINPSGNVLTLPYTLKPALSLTSKLIFVKKIEKGASVSYGATYTAEQDEWIGTLPIGYADGWNRKLQGFKVLVNGQRCEIVGRICMDQCMIRLPKEYSVGTEVVLVGTSGDDTISVVDLAEYIDTIPYELICGFAGRLRRIYK